MDYIETMDILFLVDMKSVERCSSKLLCIDIYFILKNIYYN